MQKSEVYAWCFTLTVPGVVMVILLHTTELRHPPTIAVLLVLLMVLSTLLWDFLAYRVRARRNAQKIRNFMRTINQTGTDNADSNSNRRS